jgi:cytochrome P450
LDLCITETLRLWPAVANGTFRQLQYDDTIVGTGGRPVTLPKGTFVNIVNWSRHRNPELWGDDVNEFNPNRKFEATEVASVGCPMAAANPQSLRFSPFAHAPRNCLGRNFAQMEMRLIMLYLFRRFSFSLAPPYDKLMHVKSGPTAAIDAFRGVNRGTMGPMDLEHTTEHSWGTRHQYAMKLRASPRQ